MASVGIWPQLIPVEYFFIILPVQYSAFQWVHSDEGKRDGQTTVRAKISHDFHKRLICAGTYA
jgi:hypothetical protein